MTRVLIAALLLLQLIPAEAGLARARALYAPVPAYPGYGAGREPGGSGLFVLRVDKKTGLVTAVAIEKSTGHAVLDQAAITAFSRWKLQPNTVTRLKIPITFRPKHL